MEDRIAPASVGPDRAAAAVAWDKVQSRVRFAWIAGVVSGFITLTATLLAISGHSILGFSAWELIDVLLVFGLSYGIFKRSRTCALLMLIYFIYAKILIMVQSEYSIGSLLGFVFVYFFYQGVVGTFQHHRQAGLGSVAQVDGA